MKNLILLSCLVLIGCGANLTPSSPSTSSVNPSPTTVVSAQTPTPSLTPVTSPTITVTPTTYTYEFVWVDQVGQGNVHTVSIDATPVYSGSSSYSFNEPIGYISNSSNYVACGPGGLQSTISLYKNGVLINSAVPSTSSPNCFSGSIP